MSGTAHSELAHLTSIINQENVLQVYPQASLVGGPLFFPFFFSRLFLIGVSSSHTSACLKLTKESTPRAGLESEVQGRDTGVPGSDAALALTGQSTLYLWASVSSAVRYDHENISAEAVMHLEGVLMCEAHL